MTCAGTALPLTSLSQVTDYYWERC